MEDVPHTFNSLKKSLATLESKDFKPHFEKWYLLGRMQAWKFNFDSPFNHHMKEKFILEFMKDRNVLSTIQCIAPSGICPGNPSTLVRISKHNHHSQHSHFTDTFLMESSFMYPNIVDKQSVDVEEVPCTVLSMDFFDRLEDNNIVMKSGNIQKCYDEFHEGITIADELRKMLLLEDSENYEIFSEEDRTQFLFRLFTHICVGGSLCQYEDTINAYYDVVKSLYKDLVSIQKDPVTKELSVVSKVYKFTVKDENEMVYPSTKNHIQDFAYLVVDPLKRHATLLSHCWQSIW